MRSSIAFGWSIVGLAVACGGSTPPAKTTDDKETTKTEEKASVTAPAEEKAPAEDKSEPTPAENSSSASEPACPIDVSKPATSRAGTVKVVTGCVSPEKTLKLLEQYFPQLHACFNGELRINKKGKGEVNIKINVGQKGTYSVRVHREDTTSEEFVKCMVGVLEPLPYPKPEYGGATVEFITQLR